MITQQKRPYEMSIWTLQDSYIATLKAIGENGKNQIQEPKIDLNIDGTQTLSFTIPMYYYNEEGIKVENPKWYNTINGNLIASLRKIKVIINKQRAQEKVIEFIITKVTERHEKAELYCDVECEGLAFHELGKTGYKIGLSSDDFYAADLKWFQEDGQLNKQPHATINWWCDQFLTPYPTNGEAIDPLTWYYKVDMDWSGYSEFNGSGLVARDSSKIYEEEYISSWDFKTKTIDIGNNQSITINEKVVPSAEEAYKEKERIVDFSESNKYNLTQSLAEAFSVFCKYEYTYDDAYHIIGRTVIFYNSFLKEDPIDITYKYDTSSISRNMDGTDIVTKMYVRPVDSDINDSGWITILDVDANKSKEDYILNFDYLYSIGAIDDDAYGEIENYEMQMREKNIALIPIQEKLTALNIELPEAQAQQTLAANAIQLDKERLTAADDLINNLTNNTGVIEVTNENPDTAVLLQRNGDASDVYYIKITKPGVDPNSIKIYKAIDFSAATAASRLKTDDLITSGKFEYDEFMNLIEISNLKVENITSKIVYLTYNYTPELQYERVKKTWEARLLKDTEDKSLADAKVARLEQAIADQKAAQDDLLNEKKIIMNKFERLMGAAIREGFWQPDSYNDYGDKYIESVTVELTTSDISDDMVQFEWSNKEFEGEQKLYYEIGADTQKKYYPCIRLTDDDYNVIRNIVRPNSTGWERLDTLSYLYYDTSISEQQIPRNYKCMSLGSEMTLAFVKKKTGTEIIPILLLIGAEKLSDNIINTYLSNGILGTLTVDSNHVVNVNKYLPINGNVEQGIDPIPIKWLTLDDSYEIVYPRIAINSTELKTSEDQLSVKYSGENLTNFEDYYILIDSENKKNYITLKPKTLIKYVNFPNTAQIKFTLSNAALEIYLDAIEVEKESAFPRVSYDLKVDLVREEFVTYLYNLLNRVANINDWELHFENVQGYISKVSLNLDQPWEDSLEIQNYKTKFEDLFAKIVASTEQMQKNQYTVNVASQAFDSFGNLQADAATVKLPIELNKGKVIIDKEQGIVSVNDNGMVVFRGDGIFTANEQDENGNWIWHSAILPQGINADSITTGQLDTNLINVYSGDNLKFQLKDDGLFAYKTISTDDNLMNANSTVKADLNANYKNNTDYKQYVVHNEDGLFLHAEPGAKVAKNNGDLITISNPVDRVEVSWDGLVLRNWEGDRTLYAEPDTGNLVIEGTIIANALQIGYSSGTTNSIESYVNNQIATNNTLNTTLTDLQAQIDGEIDTWFYGGTPIIENNRIAIKKIQDISTDPITYTIDYTTIETQWGLNWTGNSYDNDSLVIIGRHQADVYYDIGTQEQSSTAGQAFRFTVFYQNNQVSSYNWSAIQSTAMTEALAAASRAQEVADSKIRTFYVSTMQNWPVGQEGDLLISGSEHDKVYRYQNNGQSLEWVATEYGLSIQDGTEGLSFTTTSPTITTYLTLNKTDGLKIIGSDDGYFQANHSNLGFYDSNNNALMYYDNGHLYLQNGCQVGPWYINSNSIYYKESGFGTSGGLYWGKQGLSLSDAVKIEIGPENESLPNGNQVFKSLKFIDGSKNQDLLVFDRDNEGNFRLSLQNVTFDNSVIEALNDSMVQRVYPATSKQQLEDYINVPYGSLGVIYLQSTSPVTIPTFTNQILNKEFSGYTKDPKSLYPVCAKFTTDDGNINNGTLLSRDYHYRWQNNSAYDTTSIGSGGHFKDTTYLNIWGLSDDYQINDNYYVRAGYGNQSNRSATAYSIFTTISTVTIPAYTTFTITIPYITTATMASNLQDNTVYEAPDNPNAKVNLDIWLYLTNRPDLTYTSTTQVNYLSNYSSTPLSTLELGKTVCNFSTGGTVIATISIPQSITLEPSSCLYVFIKAPQYIANSLKLIAINKIELEIATMSGNDDRGLYYYDNTGTWQLIKSFVNS